LVAGYQLGLVGVSVFGHHVGWRLRVLLRVQSVLMLVVLRGEVRHIFPQIVEIPIHWVRLIFGAVGNLLLLLQRGLLRRVASELLRGGLLLNLMLLDLDRGVDFVVGLKRHVLLVVLLFDLTLLDLNVWVLLVHGFVRVALLVLQDVCDLVLRILQKLIYLTLALVLY
jgi:hypothetical protein